MKKILVVLLILAVAGGVFAQDGSWSIGGSADVGVRVDFDPIPGEQADGEVAVIQSIGYQEWNATHGEATLSYSNGGLNISLGWNTREGEGGPSVSYNGDNYKFAVDSSLSQIINSDSSSISRLWGEYLFLNGLVSLEAAYNSRDNGDGTWTSDKTGVFNDFGILGSAGPATGWGAPVNRTNFYANSPFGDGDTFAKFDHPSLLMANINLDAIVFGIQVRNLFDRDGLGINRYATYGYLGAKTPFIDEVIKKSIVGLKFNMAPLEVAAQFKLEQAGVYFGGRFFAGPITVGLSFNGLLNEREEAGEPVPDTKRFRFGGSVGYNAGAFGAGVKGYYDKTGTNNTNTVVGIVPTFFFNAIPSHLRFAVDTGFFFFTKKTGDEETSDLVWAVQPQFSWNFRGTGAGEYFWGGSGIMIRYRMASTFDALRILGGSPISRTTTTTEITGIEKDGANFLDVVFKWSFF